MGSTKSLLSSSGPGPGQVKVRWRSGEGQEGQIQAKYSSKNSKLKDLDLSSTLFLVFTNFFLGFQGV